jgi:hypothetical protein
MKTRRQITAELDQAVGERSEALRWVLGLGPETEALPGLHAAKAAMRDFDKAAA